MKRGFVEQIFENSQTAVIRLESEQIMTIPFALLPKNIDIDDFVIMENGVMAIDPENKKKRQQISEKLTLLLEK